MKTIAFIGSGKMAEAVMARLPKAYKIILSDVSKKRLTYLSNKYKAKIAKNNLAAFKSANIVILSVKPQNISEVLSEIRNSKLATGNSKLIISIAAGIPLAYLQKKLPGLPIVRVMPNNPALVGLGVSALCAGKKVSPANFKQAENIFKAVGEVVKVSEKLMDAVTGLSGSGPAFAYEAINALALGGVAAGLPKNIATKLSLMTVLGAAYTVFETGKSPEELIKMVASPGGTTLEGLAVLKKKKFSKTLIEAVVMAAKKSKKLSKKWTL